MAFVHGTSSRIFLNDKHISGTSSGFTCSNDASLAETSNLLSGGANFIPGMTDGTLSFEGFIESSYTDTVEEAIRDASQSAQGALLTAAPAGLTVGRPAFFCKADISEFEVETSVDDAISFSSEAQGYEGVDWGITLHDHTAVTENGEGTAQDNTESTSNGGAAILHVTDVSGTSPTADILVEHSADDVTYTTLVTFTQATGKTQEFKEVTGTVNRYIRVSYTIGGTTPSFTFLLAFARR